MPPQTRLFSVAFISPQNHPILVRTFATDSQGNRTKQDILKANYAAHTALDVFDERSPKAKPSPDCYLGLLYALDDLAVYGYLTPTKLKIVVATTLTDTFIKDSEMSMIFRAFHAAYYRAISNPFLRMGLSEASINDPAMLLQSNPNLWKSLKRNVDEIANIIGPAPPSTRPSVLSSF